MKLTTINMESVIQSEVRKKKQTSYINAHMWNLQKWYQWTHWQEQRCRHREQTLDIMGEGEAGTNWESIIDIYTFSSVQSLKSCPTLCDLTNRSMPDLPVYHQLLEFTQTHVHQVSDAIQPSHPLLLPIPPSIRVFSNESAFCIGWPKDSQDYLSGFEIAQLEFHHLH